MPPRQRRKGRTKSPSTTTIDLTPGLVISARRPSKGQLSSQIAKKQALASALARENNALRRALSTAFIKSTSSDRDGSVNSEALQTVRKNIAAAEISGAAVGPLSAQLQGVTRQLAALENSQVRFRKGVRTRIAQLNKENSRREMQLQARFRAAKGEAQRAALLSERSNLAMQRDSLIAQITSRVNGFNTEIESQRTQLTQQYEDLSGKIASERETFATLPLLKKQESRLAQAIER